MQRVLIAGASGVLGRTVAALLRGQGYRVRALSRSPARAAAIAADEIVIGDATRLESIATLCEGVDIVFSCLGQSVSADPANRGPGYHAIDYVGNHQLIEHASRAGVRRFVYVSVFQAEQHPRVAYFRAHADVAAELRRSGLGYAVIQPTGFFSAFSAFFEMARSGRAVVFGDGSARSNPIHDADLAAVCAEAVGDTQNRDIPVGGPEVLSRREIIELAFAASGKPVKISHAPAWAPGLIGGLIRPLAPRLGELASFLGVVSGGDFIAPAYGARRLAAFYRELASADSADASG
jgi:uncharacterized protein YbjT (DUF2867 family)